MDNLELLSYVGLIALGVLLVKNWLSNLPPSPWGLPVIGHLHLALTGIPFRSLDALTKKHRSPILSLKLGAIPAIVVSSPELAKEVLKNQDQTFASRPWSISGKYFGYDFMDMAFVPYNDHWRSMRKMCTTELFTARRIDLFAWVRREELISMLKSLIQSHQKQQAVTLRDPLTIFSFNSMTRILISKKFFGAETDVDPDATEFKEMVHAAVDQTLRFSLSQFVPAYLRWMDWAIPQVMEVHRRCDKFMSKILEERKAESHQEARKVEDFMDIIMKFVEDQPNGDEIVKAMILELITAGTDTSAATLEWAAAELVLNPQIAKIVQEEIDKVVGSDRMVEESDIQQFEYFHAVIKEVFRLHPPAGLLLPRLNTRACKLAGYDIPKGMTTLVNVYSIGRDPQVWESPEEFKPERFVGKNIDFKGQDFELIPFGAGRRSCPAMSMGMRSVNLVLANLIHGFNLSSVPGTSPSLEERSGNVTWMKTPLEVVVTPRFSDEVYAKWGV